MYNRGIKTHLAIFSACCLLLILMVESGAAAETATAEATYTLEAVNTDIAEDMLTVRLVGSSPPAFTSRELYDPYRLIIDIAAVTLGKGLVIADAVPENKFAELQTTVVKGLKPEVTRFVFSIKEGFTQKLEREGNDLALTITPVISGNEPKETLTGKADSGPSADAVSRETVADSSADSTLRELIESSMQQGKNGAQGADNSSKDSFSFAGYKKKRISIDFYKIDIHNVFRLFRQISGANIIIDEGVQGTVTLALKDVPWDFALDIILNLSDLAKEEKFNTIVIYPKDKEFVWPQRSIDNLSFEENLEVVQQEALIIEQSANQPKEIMQAKDLMRKARLKETQNDFEQAADLYEEAFDLWPQNDALATRLAALYLVRLGMNAKGVFYAKKSLEVNPDENYKAALYAAIGTANMNKIPEAVEYFSQSISGDPPMKEALVSFAAFSESAGRLESALKLYDKYHDYYGESVNSLVAKARIYDLLGETAKADKQYKAVLVSGFQLQTGLRKYIEGRLSAANN